MFSLLSLLYLLERENLLNQPDPLPALILTSDVDYDSRRSGHDSGKRWLPKHRLGRLSTPASCGSHNMSCPTLV